MSKKGGKPPGARKGKSKDPVLSAEAQTEQLARDLFQEGRLEEVVELCQNGLDLYPKAYEIWKIFGAALGGLGRTKDARRAFLAALEIVPGDGTAVANYITSCFHDGDVVSACNAIELYFDELSNEAQTVVLATLGESIQTGLVDESQLPPVILTLFEESNDVLNDLEFEAVAESQEDYVLEDSEKEVILKAISDIASALEASKAAVSTGQFPVRDAEAAFAYIEEKLVEIAVILDSATPYGEGEVDEDFDNDDDGSSND